MRMLRVFIDDFDFLNFGFSSDEISFSELKEKLSKQLKALVKQCGIEEKIELVRVLEEDTLKIRFKRLLEELKTDAADLTFEEITAETEAVRQEQYNAESRHQSCN